MCVFDGFKKLTELFFYRDLIKDKSDLEWICVVCWGFRNMDLAGTGSHYSFLITKTKGVIVEELKK